MAQQNTAQQTTPHMDGVFTGLNEAMWRLDSITRNNPDSAYTTTERARMELCSASLASVWATLAEIENLTSPGMQEACKHLVLHLPQDATDKTPRGHAVL